ncbi:MAG: hypothetical protein LBU48_02350, partial [Coriobacteriales bacterium]|nr:hypothetical protein [Coriobacteriales bacterium]
SHSGKVHRYFACSGGINKKNDCNTKRIPVAELEDYVFEKTVEYFEDEAVLSELLDALEAYAKQDVDHVRVDELKAAKRENERRQKNLIGFLETGTDSDIRERLESLRKEHASLTTEIANELIRQEPPSRDLMQFFIEDLLSDGTNDKSKKNRILDDFVYRVAVSETHTTIEYNYTKMNSETLAYTKIPGFAQFVFGGRYRI